MLNRMLIALALIVLGGLTVLAVGQDGVTGIFTSIFDSWGAMQIYTDLVIALLLICVWMWHDAQGAGRNPWPWIVATVLVGSFSPLVYLLTRRTPGKV